MKKKRAADKRTRRREQSAPPAVQPTRATGNRMWRWLIAGGLLVAVGGGSLYVHHWYVRGKLMRLARECRQTKAKGDWPQLELLARDWAIWQPNQSEAWILAADAAKQMGNSQRAADYLSRMPDSAPVEAFYELGRLQFEDLNQPFATLETCRRTLRIHPADVESHQRLLYFFGMTCQRESLIAEARRAIRDGGDSLPTYAYLIGAKWLTFTNGNAVNGKWLEAHPDNELFAVAAMIHLIAHREELGQRFPAVAEGELSPMEKYEQLVVELQRRYPDNVELKACRGNLLCQAGQIDDVRALLSKAPAETESDSRFWRFKGWYHAALEQWSEAREAYEQALRLWPFDWMSQHELAAVLRRSETLEAANEMQTRATLGKELMRDILLAPRLDASSRETFDKIADYMRLCGDEATAKSLRRRLEAPRGRESFSRD